MINNPLVSIIVPVYNVEPYIEQCCRSVFEQTYDNCEFIFVDDCGSDRSMEILYGLIEEYAHLKGRIRILHNEGNKGIVITRKNGIEAAKGEYVQFVDSDDYVKHDMTEQLVKLAVEHDADMVICDYDTDYGEIEHMNQHVVTLLDNIHCMCLELQADVRSVVVWNKLIRRRLLDDNQLAELSNVWCNEDGVLMFCAYYHSKTIVSTTQSFYYYRRVLSSMVNSFKRYRNSSPDVLLQLLRVRTAFIEENEITDVKLMEAFAFHKLYMLKMLVLYTDFKLMREKDKVLFGDVKFSFVYKHFKAHWPEGIVWMIWKSRQWWIVGFLRLVRDRHWYIG